MNTLLIFFALPIATIILVIVIEKILRCPILTALTFFAIYLIVAFAAFDASFLIFVIAYTIIAYITAWIVELFFSRCRRNCPCRENNDNDNNNNEVQLSNADMQNIATRVANILNNNSNCNCNCNNNNTATVNVRDTNGCQTTWCCRRR